MLLTPFFLLTIQHNNLDLLLILHCIILRIPASDLLHFILIRGGRYLYASRHEIVNYYPWRHFLHRWRESIGQRKSLLSWLYSINSCYTFKLRLHHPAYLLFLRHDGDRSHTEMCDLVLNSRCYLNALESVGIHETHLFKEFLRNRWFGALACRGVTLSLAWSF